MTLSMADWRNCRAPRPLDRLSMLVRIATGTYVPTEICNKRGLVSHPCKSFCLTVDLRMAALVGMAACIARALRAPFASILFALEFTGQFNTLLSLSHHWLRYGLFVFCILDKNHNWDRETVVPRYPCPRRVFPGLGTQSLRA